ncbi:MAG: hypothetical protein NVS4B12_26430 [Ktedonobacteraceae bacterium]
MYSQSFIALRYKFQPLNLEQVQQFLAVAVGHRLAVLFVLVLSTGPEKEEVKLEAASGTGRRRRDLNPFEEQVEHCEKITG